MPKMKTNRSASKRFTRTKNGGFKHKHAFARHLKAVKSPKRRRNLRQATMAAPEEIARIKRLLPYT